MLWACRDKGMGGEGVFEGVKKRIESSVFLLRMDLAELKLLPQSRLVCHVTSRFSW